MTLSYTRTDREGNFARAAATVRRELCRAMQRLVSPELRVYTVLTVSDREALSELVTELRLDKILAGNLRQLLGFRTVGRGRQARQVAEDWQLLESVRWLKHLESGKLAFRSWAAMRSAFSNVAVHRLQMRADMNF